MLLGVGNGAIFLIIFVLFQGAGFGMASIIRPILIADLLGRRRFGTIAGILAVPFLLAMALAPSLAGVIWGAGGYNLLILITAVIGLFGLCALGLAAHCAKKV